MIKNMRIKKTLVVLALSLPVGGFCLEKHNNKYYLCENRNDSIYIPYGYVNDHYIYIGDYLENDEILEGNDLVIKNHSRSDDPNYIIVNSYKIKNPFERLEILKLLMEYDKEHPSGWDRSLLSMEIEWLVHNICYDLNYENSKTKDVDLNNDDENFIKFLKNNF